MSEQVEFILSPVAAASRGARGERGSVSRTGPVGAGGVQSGERGPSVTIHQGLESYTASSTSDIGWVASRTGRPQPPSPDIDSPARQSPCVASRAEQASAQLPGWDTDTRDICALARNYSTHCQINTLCSSLPAISVMVGNGVKSSVNFFHFSCSYGLLWDVKSDYKVSEWPYLTCS